MNEKLRRENIVWTVSEDYSYSPVLNLFDNYGNFDMDYYKMSVLGMVYKFVDMDAFLEFISNCLSKTELKNEYLKVVEIFLDDCFFEYLIAKRNGVEDFRQRFFDGIESKYAEKKMEFGDKFLDKISVEEEIEHVYYSSINKKFIESRNALEDMVSNLRLKSDMIRKKISSLSSEVDAKTEEIRNEGLSIETKQTINEDKTDEIEDREVSLDDARVDLEITGDIINSLNAVFLKYFYKNIRSNKDNLDDFSSDEKKKDSDKSKKDVSDEKPPRLNFKMKKKHLKDLKNEDNIGSFSIESAEFTGELPDDVDINDERLKKKTDPKILNSNSKVREMILARYGDGIYPEYVTDFLESKICSGIHEGIKIHFTGGKFTEGNYDKYFYNSILAQRDKNLEYYSDNELVFRRSITELREIIRKKIFVEDNEDYISKSGEIIVPRIWRNRILGDENIFMRRSKEDIGDLSVDILLDSSSSQDGREEIVAAQAYIISEALVSLNIPTRVYGFCNFFNYLVMREYRDYNDPISRNKSIFDYKTSGSNRDGLAIKFISKHMETLENNNKILIVLSDGRPNDKINLGAIGFMKIDGQDYEGEVAIKDTASEIFNLKMRGNHVLGVFTGEDEDLEDEKRIYGKDFAYIRNIDRFSRIIGFYLEQLII